jgi:hypothetical protein
VSVPKRNRSECSLKSVTTRAVTSGDETAYFATSSHEMSKLT